LLQFLRSREDIDVLDRVIGCTGDPELPAMCVDIRTVGQLDGLGLGACPFLAAMIANPSTTEFLVLGGGISGLSLAWHLAARASGSVVLLERSAQVGGMAASVPWQGVPLDLVVRHLLRLT
jgi:hypothetical protein